jgi:hypothetical protein
MHTKRVVILAGHTCLALVTAATAETRREADRPRYMIAQKAPPISLTMTARAPAAEEPPPWMERNMAKAMEIQDSLRGEAR